MTIETMRNLRVRCSRLPLGASCVHLLRDKKGLAAIEFAMILPFMLTLWIGSIEISQAVAIDRKVGLTARAVADLTSQSTTITNSDMANIMDATSALLFPYNVGPLKVVVSAVKVDGSGNATVKWSDAKNTTARAKDSSVSLPSAIAVPNTQVIWGEVSYAYTPMFGYLSLPTMNLTEQNFVRPRETTDIIRKP